MIKTRFISCLLIIGTIKSHCNPTEKSNEFIKAFDKAEGTKLLREGLYGNTVAFEYKNKKYAVKEMKFVDDNHLFGQEVFRINGKEEELFKGIADSFAKSLIEGQKFKDFDLLLQTTKIYERYKKLKSFYTSTLSEVSMSQLVSIIKKHNPEDRLKFDFCAQVDKFRYLIVYDKYGEALNSEASREFFKEASIKKRLEVYLKIEWAVININNNNNKTHLFHCNLNPANFAWKDKIGGDIILIELGYLKK
jgi:hypothetical protein